jgi:hypothetical protein
MLPFQCDMQAAARTTMAKRSGHWQGDQDRGAEAGAVPPAQFLLTLLLPEAECNSLPGYRAPPEEYTLIYSGDDKSVSYDICKDFKVGAAHNCTSATRLSLTCCELCCAMSFVHCVSAVRVACPAHES